MITVKLTKSPKRDKKWRVIVPGPRAVDFGAKGYSDYTIHKDRARMRRYVARHARQHENWSLATGLRTAGFWSRWLLWSEPSLEGAKRLMRRKFSMRFV